MKIFLNLMMAGLLLVLLAAGLVASMSVHRYRFVTGCSQGSFSDCVTKVARRTPIQVVLKPGFSSLRESAN